ncbi:HNH endonuclease [Nocardioides coralli]|uniref:HNH endonuclease n=1 Tax=Nocardioides coralli TaxID=2872154 RepID=UPI001CA389B4|nr:HNH endonuclease signature motif containing protein [Nocardioides coralli]QZY29919.1 HNH endonuclease [Nocardioides coralli]
MIERTASARPGAATPLADDVLAFARSLAGEVDGLDDAARVDLLRALEVLKSAAEGIQAVVAADLDASRRASAAARGVPGDRQGRGVAHEVALARRVSPHRGQRLLALATVLTREMPCTLAALRTGRITEWSATLLARETACLSLHDRQQIDRSLCGDPVAAEQMGPRELGDRARALASELDPASVVARRSKAEGDRHVTIRPAPDTMTWLTGHLPVKAGVAVYAALRAEADRLVAAGDGRGRGQIMADTLVDRVLGGTVDASSTVRVNVVIGVDALLAETDEAADIPGHGAVPASTVRDWIRQALASGGGLELRRLFADPVTGQLVAMESRSRTFPRALSELIALRDRRCRTPWCGAPVRHVDHVVSHADGGPTSADNGQGLCQACNHAKQAHGWSARPRPGPGHGVTTTTPTGHTYASTAAALIRGRTGAGGPRVDWAWAA